MALLPVLVLLPLLGLLQVLRALRELVLLHLTPQAHSASLPRSGLDVLESRCSVPPRSGRMRVVRRTVSVLTRLPSVRVRGAMPIGSAEPIISVSVSRRSRRR